MANTKISCQTPDSIPSECIEQNGAAKNVVCTENRRVYRIDSEVDFKRLIIKVDNCLITSSTDKKVDYLILLPEKCVAILVELKGNDFSKGIDQLIDTLNKLESRFCGWTFHARYISRSVPAAVAGPKKQRLIKAFGNEAKRVKIHSTTLCEAFSTF